MNHLAIDLETLSLEPNAHILSIGAVFFDPKTGEFGPTLYCEIDPHHDQPNAHISASTVTWWMGQDSGVVPRHGTWPISDALRELIAFIDNHVTQGEPLKVFQQGDRDAMWLNNAAREQGLVMPWTYRDVNCSRTLWEHMGHTAGLGFMDFDGVQHNALDDARFVALRMCEVLR